MINQVHTIDDEGKLNTVLLCDVLKDERCEYEVNIPRWTWLALESTRTVNLCYSEMRHSQVSTTCRDADVLFLKLKYFLREKYLFCHDKVKTIYSNQILSFMNKLTSQIFPVSQILSDCQLFHLTFLQLNSEHLLYWFFFYLSRFWLFRLGIRSRGRTCWTIPST